MFHTEPLQVSMAAVVTNNFVRTGKIAPRLDSFELTCMDSIKFDLESYHYCHSQRMADKMRKENRKYFLDSGAFSAFMVGAKIDLPTYCGYIKKNHDMLALSSVLDSIGDAKGTYWNQKAMENLLPRELWPAPCFHWGESPEVLKYYVDNYDYITIGGMVPISTAQLTVWLDYLWGQHLTHPDGTPKVKVHGFGLTSLPLMQRYPWYSVDSSSWIMFGNNGMVLLPGIGKAVNVSSKSGRRKDAGQHLDTFTEIERITIEKEIAGYGADPQRLRDLYYSRWALNCWAIPEYVRLRGGGCKRFIQVQQGLFD